MLFAYTYVPHQMEKMQEFIDFIFEQVWCQAPTNGPFGLNLFTGNADLYEVMEAFLYSDAAGADFFYGNVEGIHGLFATLNAADIAQFQAWYQGNNDVQRVCDNDPAIQLARYADISVNYKAICDQLNIFFKGLYSQSLLGLAALRSKIGHIDDHYLSFVLVNKSGKCPFCGINDLLSEYHNKREAYDHYLPKAIYPFNSINFKNLVPACHHCNSSYKTSKDPAYVPKDPTGATNRRAVFYPYTTLPHSIDFHVELHNEDIENLNPADIHLTFGPTSVSEQIETWKDVYGIEERYKAKLCSADAIDWIEQFRILNRRRHFPAREYLEDIEEASPYANCNFLKKAFMHGCEKIGLLSAIENYRDDNSEEQQSN